MAKSVRGTHAGPYGQIRSLRNEINAYKYELSLIGMGMRRRFGAKRFQAMIQKNRARIKKILQEEKRKKKEDK